jgi:hypothetical protein
LVLVALSNVAPPVSVRPPVIVVVESVEAPAERDVPESVVPLMVPPEIDVFAIDPPVMEGLETVGFEMVSATLLVGARLLMLLVRDTSLCRASSCAWTLGEVAAGRVPMACCMAAVSSACVTYLVVRVDPAAPEAVEGECGVVACPELVESVEGVEAGAASATAVALKTAAVCDLPLACHAGRDGGLMVTV